VLTVSVEDVSRTDAPATTLARTAVTVDGQVPVPFSVAIDAADIDPRARVAVRARLRSSVGTWVSDTHHPVDFHGAGSVADIILRRLPDG
jgi:putative lipoprotein